MLLVLCLTMLCTLLTAPWWHFEEKRMMILPRTPCRYNTAPVHVTNKLMHNLMHFSAAWPFATWQKSKRVFGQVCIYSDTCHLRPLQRKTTLWCKTTSVDQSVVIYCHFHLPFKITCYLRPNFGEPQGGLKWQVPLLISLTYMSLHYFQSIVSTHHW